MCVFKCYEGEGLMSVYVFMGRGGVMTNECVRMCVCECVGGGGGGSQSPVASYTLLLFYHLFKVSPSLSG